MRARCLGWISTVLLTSAAAAASSPPPSFTSLEIRSLVGLQGNVSAAGLNDHGDVTGTSQYPPGSTNPSGPFVYYHANGVELALNGFGVGGINDAGKIAGEVVSLSTGPQAVVWPKSGGVQILPSNNIFAEADAINNAGDVAGNIDNGHADNFAVMWSPRPALHNNPIGEVWGFRSIADKASITASASPSRHSSAWPRRCSSVVSPPSQRCACAG